MNVDDFSFVSSSVLFRFAEQKDIQGNKIHLHSCYSAICNMHYHSMIIFIVYFLVIQSMRDEKKRKKQVKNFWRKERKS